MIHCIPHLYCHWYLVLIAKDGNLLLLEIPPALLIYQNQIQVIPRAELLVDVSEGRCEFKATQEQSDGNGFASNRCTVHDFKLGNGFRFIVLIRC